MYSFFDALASAFVWHWLAMLVAWLVRHLRFPSL
jgi:hypothetical protein